MTTLADLGCRTKIQHDYELRRQPAERRGCRARCFTCDWHGPWVKYAHTAERHRKAHLYVGAHRA